MLKMTTYPYQSLQQLSTTVFRTIGCSAPHAELAAQVLASADLRGVDSHGIARLAGYVRLWERQRVNAQPSIRVVHETPSTAVVDGDAGLGLVVAPYAMEVAINKARTAGTGWVAVRNSNHFGIAGYHAMMALPHDMIGIALTNASPLVAPTFAIDRLLGTNPIAVAIPAGEQPPLVVEMATTTVANGKLEILQRKDQPAPQGWIQDETGHSSTDPGVVARGGALLPLGGDTTHGGHKGYCLGAVVDIFSAVFSGANYGPWVPPFVSFLDPPADPVGQGIGHFLGAIRIDAFRPAAEFKQHMDRWITTFRGARTAEGHERVLIPGDPERATEAKRREEGVPLLKPVVDDLLALEKRLGIAVNLQERDQP
jgi:LDH2 family malate/lactate/ureidoglycolate dehydrogenase